MGIAVSHISWLLKHSGIYLNMYVLLAATSLHILCVFKWSRTNSNLDEPSLFAASHVSWFLNRLAIYGSESGFMRTVSLHISWDLKWSGLSFIQRGTTMVNRCFRAVEGQILWTERMTLCAGYFKVVEVKNNSITKNICWFPWFIDIKRMNIHQKMVILIEKTMKPYSNAMILSLKNYENISKCNSIILLIRHIDGLGKYFEVVIYRYKGVVIFRCTKNILWIDTSKHKFIWCKTTKTYWNSSQTSSNNVWFIRINIAYTSCVTSCRAT